MYFKYTILPRYIFEIPVQNIDYKYFKYMLQYINTFFKDVFWPKIMVKYFNQAKYEGVQIKRILVWIDLLNVMYFYSKFWKLIFWKLWKLPLKSTFKSTLYYEEKVEILQNTCPIDSCTRNTTQVLFYYWEVIWFVLYNRRYSAIITSFFSFSC